MANQANRQNMIPGQPSTFQARQPVKPVQQPQLPGRNRKHPIHTAFFSNIPYNFPMDKFQEFALSFGEIANMYSLINTKGIAFVTYYDIRNAQKAVEQANEKILGGRPVRTNYANKSHFQHQDPSQTCSAILIKSLANPPKLTIHEVINKMKDYGEINTATPIEGQQGTFVVKYFNIKDAHKVIQSNVTQIGQEQTSLEFKLEDEDNPDIQTTPKPAQQFRQPMAVQQPPPAYGMPGMPAQPQFVQQPPTAQYGYQQQPYGGYGQPPPYGMAPGQPPNASPQPNQQQTNSQSVMEALSKLKKMIQ
ncbi:hypothetical protein TRFO_19655 [Tritrichomonas foetus]|uniref:RRM domain-containing protein n=1 Tax=Tritrichomonas foetus TaxID=1144522 RepID=A0A1J4KMN3_9EUKA|nr:hypothetical protein TRFO_19655 [Tritrichomonas foetus]|eukprot:OHT10950.1 hypothetical protein TRFO_19655 [Tritrichomonas foetus]